MGSPVVFFIFIGEPHSSPLHQDYVPNIFPEIYKDKRTNFVDIRRLQRHQKRAQKKDSPVIPIPSAAESIDRIKANITTALKEEEIQEQTEEAALALIQLSCTTADKGTQTDQAIQTTHGTQTHKVTYVDAAQQADIAIREPNEHPPHFSVSMIEGNDKATQFYTGLPTWAVFFHLFMFISPFASSTPCVINLENQLFITLTKLRLNLLYEDLAGRCGVSIGTVSTIFDRWLDIMYSRLKFLIAWPTREVVQHNMPEIFKQLYPNCRCIIDCSEVFIETPENFDARSKTYSNYKKHNTIKFLVAVTPCGSISFLSKCWGGRVSDKILTKESNFLNLLEPGDVVLADRGFTVAEDIALFGAKLEIPAFTRGKKQLSQREVETSQQLSRVRIHVERVIGLLKNKYTILKGQLPVQLLKHNDNSDVANIDKILCVCGALTNLAKKIV